jgi:hypothetical protein
MISACRAVKAPISPAVWLRPNRQIGTVAALNGLELPPTQRFASNLSSVAIIARFLLQTLHVARWGVNLRRRIEVGDVGDSRTCPGKYGVKAGNLFVPPPSKGWKWHEERCLQADNEEHAREPAYGQLA